MPKIDNAVTPWLLGLGLTFAVGSATHAEEWPAPIRQLENQGLSVLGTFDAPGGLEGYVARFQGQPVAAYLTPDGKHAVVGTLIDASGRDVAAETLEQMVNGPENAELWQKMAKSHWARDGDADAPRIVYTFSDPNCPYCRQFWHDAQPWIESGQVQVRHVLVGVLKADSPEKAAKLLSADDPGQAIAQHYRNGAMPDGRTRQSQQWVAENTQLMNEAQLYATPVTFYRDDGGVHRVTGAPSPDKLRDIMGSDAP